MVDWGNASGSMNPADRNPATTGYYNGTVIRDVLGANYVDPNAWSISAEIAGRRADGPTDAQVRAVIAWGKDMADLFPTLRGAYGHADQTGTKGCPGLTPNMKAIFDGLGGHGLWTSQETTDMGEYVVPFGAQLPFTITGTARSFGATAPYPPLSDLSGTVPVDAAVVLLQAAVPHGPLLRVVTGATGRRLVAAAAGTLGGSDCTDAVDAEHERTRAAAIKAVEAIK